MTLIVVVGTLLYFALGLAMARSYAKMVFSDQAATNYSIDDLDAQDKWVVFILLLFWPFAIVGFFLWWGILLLVIYRKDERKQATKKATKGLLSIEKELSNLEKGK